ncbi:Uncharacterised protein [Mycobacteroides abscessus subsp. abscessus]|jgi:hypothetical protein|uniref:hypothetical protein n=1 Tax=Mycobacteroides abscessus TaxID=36809 RepID=UPI0009289864|nr:hypothetical protein [Mycobacteroides abscessus]SIH26489.1 Uncharacterised protein [Mycobacteroides abscessus subsp. abscessus]
MSDQYKSGACWASRDGQCNVVLVKEIHGSRVQAFIIRNLTTGRESHIEVTGLNRKFHFVGHDPAFTP